MKILFLLFPLLAVTIAGYSQTSTGVVNGTVTYDGEAVSDVNIGFPELQLGGATNQEGEFSIKNVPAGTHTLEVSAIGYKKFSRQIEVPADTTIELNVELEESVTELDQITITGTMRETFIADSPVKVEVISDKFLSKNPSGNLMESINYINGLYNEVSCGVCGTNSVRINGMEGPYTSVLIDGMPIMGSLASVYGLNGINPDIIRTIEIIKGPNSTLYGSEAMGGVINILTKNPRDASRLTLDGSTSSHREHNLDFSYSPEISGVETYFSGNGFYFDHFLDANTDNFADIPMQKRLSLFNKWRINRPEDRTFDIAAKYLYEDRMGGTPEFSRDLRGSDRIYGEAIETNRFELLGSYQLPVGLDDFRVDYSYSYHKQNSYYGDYHYKANQQIYHSNLIWDKRFSYDHQLLLGSTLRYDALDQTFDGQRLDNGSEDHRFTPGLFAEYERIFNEHARALLGARVDHYEDHGFIVSPRLNGKIDAGDHTTFRLNTGTGFRIVNLFTEEHEALSGSRQVVLTEDLAPERSYNITFNLNQIVDIGVSVLNIDFDTFYTRFSNQIIPDYSIPNEIRYGNLDEYSISRGLALNAAHNFPGPLEYSVGITYQDVFQQAEGKQSLPFSPKWNSVFSISYLFDAIDTSVDYTGRIVGKMHLPEYPDAPTHSEVFTEQNVTFSRPLIDGLETYLSIKNLLNYTQKNPIIAPDRPFSDDFATDHVYGPLQGRRFMVGFKWTVD